MPSWAWQSWSFQVRLAIWSPKYKFMLQSFIWILQNSSMVTWEGLLFQSQNRIASTMQSVSLSIKAFNLLDDAHLHSGEQSVLLRVNQLWIFIISVLIHLCSYNRIPETDWLIKNKDWFLTVLEAGKSKVEGSASGRSLWLCHPMVKNRWARESRWEREKEGDWTHHFIGKPLPQQLTLSSDHTLILSWVQSPHGLSTSQWPHVSILLCWGLSFQTLIFRRHIQAIATRPNAFIAMCTLGLDQTTGSYCLTRLTCKVTHCRLYNVENFLIHSSAGQASWEPIIKRTKEMA
jgi:hypothetical protein